MQYKDIKMKQIVILLVMTPFLLYSQKRDTIVEKSNGENRIKMVEYYESKLPQKEDYWSRKGLASKYTEEESFMMGHPKVRGIGYFTDHDSTIYYYQNAKIKRKDIYDKQETLRYNYSESWTLNYITREVKGNIECIDWQGLEIELKDEVIFYEGRIGEKENRTIKIKNKLNEEVKLWIASTGDGVEIEQELIEIGKEEEKSIRIDYIAKRKDLKTEIKIRNGRGQELNLPLRISGYDIEELDFEGETSIELVSREKIIFKNDGGSKLLKIYKSDELISIYALSEMLPEISVGEMALGDYKLELINLRDNSKKQCKVILK